MDALGATVHEFAAMVSLPFLGGWGRSTRTRTGFKNVRCFTMVDDNDASGRTVPDPPSGTPRVVKAEEAKEWAEKIAVQK